MKFIVFTTIFMFGVVSCGNERKQARTNESKVTIEDGMAIGKLVSSNEEEIKSAEEVEKFDVSGKGCAAIKTDIYSHIKLWNDLQCVKQIDRKKKLYFIGARGTGVSAHRRQHRCQYEIHAQWKKSKRALKSKKCKDSGSEADLFAPIPSSRKKS